MHNFKRFADLCFAILKNQLLFSESNRCKLTIRRGLCMLQIFFLVFFKIDFNPLKSLKLSRDIKI